MSGLPELIDPLQLAEKNEQLSGEMDFSAMERLQSLLENKSGRIKATLGFTKSTEGHVYISGDFSTDVQLLCQRCLEPYDLTLSNEINIGLVKGEEDVELIEADYDPVIIREGRLSLVNLLEDEILLGLPIAPMHETGECSARGSPGNTEEVRKSPFAVLKNLDISKD